MPWIKLPEVDGLVYEPERTPEGRRKHNCPDCYFCQMCSDVRCEECRREKAGQKKKKRVTKVRRRKA